MCCGKTIKAKENKVEPLSVEEQIYKHTTYIGDILDFEIYGIDRKNVTSITKIGENEYFVISINQ